MELTQRLLSFTILTSFLHSALGKSTCVIDYRTKYQEYEKKLEDDLMEKGYAFDEGPSLCNTTEVTVRITMKHFELDSESELFSMHSITTLSWTDKRYTWDPADYGGVDTTIFFTYQYWTPEITLNNQHDDEYGIYYAECKLRNDGFVICAPRVTNTVQCSITMTDWPYDTQRCTLEFGVSKIQRNVRLRTTGKRVVHMVGAEYGTEWTIVDYEQATNVSDATHISMTFVLERNGETLGAVVIFPSILIAILVPSLVILDVKDNKRLYMMIFCVMCHMFYLRELVDLIPRHGKDVPGIVLFFRFSLVFNMVLLGVTIGLIKARDRATAPPGWLSKFNDSVLESHGKYFVWPRWKTTVDRSVSVDAKDVETWNNFANILNSACLFVTIIINAIMASLFIPRPPTFN